jgi:spore photoproduct lyase
MIYYDGWREDYAGVARRIVDSFDSTEVSFLSLGSVTLIKPVIKKIRELGNPTKILQMELVPDPHGKLTYPDALKVEMFQVMHQALAPWHQDVFMYLCMEKAQIWEQALGRSYASNDEFELNFALRTARR